MYELIITEKPSAAKKIAEALADGEPIKENINTVPYYKITHGKKEIVVACAVGHLYGLGEEEKKGWQFPVFDIGWKPTSDTKGSEFTKKYLNAIKKLSKHANEFTIACDYDQEGSVIGKNIITLACKKKDGARMKFSTLTKDELRESYKNKSKHLDWGQIEAGETRHYLDFFNGVNYSRALTSAIKSAGSFKIMSTGRVQGPALKIIVHREKEIKSFIPKEFWQIQLFGEYKKQLIKALHKEDKFWDKDKAEGVFNKVKDKEYARIDKIEKRQFNQQAPYPFDLTSLQTEAYRCFNISPKQTLEIAQELYVSSFISYPRTSSQQLPESIGYAKILSDLLKQKQYLDSAKTLLSHSKLLPNNGKKTDPAHPAIFPTGIAPKVLEEREAKIYDLIVKRFISTFGEPAVREIVSVDINCNDEIFIAKGSRTIERGWHFFYEPYVKLEEIELPDFKESDKISVNKIDLLSKETQPPKRYTPASIIKELERRNLGTKSTRSEIIDTLYKRGYVKEKSIEATELGISTIGTLQKYCEKIIDEELTRHFEIEMEKIREGKQNKQKILDDAKEAITKIMADFKKHQKQIGTELSKANRSTQDEMCFLGLCPICKNGNLTIRRGKYGNFSACNKYPECKTVFSLPKNTFVKPANKYCDICNFPKVVVVKKKSALELCLNPNCPSKEGKMYGSDSKVDTNKSETSEIKPEPDVNSKCPLCKKGTIVLRNSFYGKFYGCNIYPKCRYTQSYSKVNK